MSACFAAAMMVAPHHSDGCIPTPEVIADAARRRIAHCPDNTIKAVADELGLEVTPDPAATADDETRRQVATYALGLVEQWFGPHGHWGEQDAGRLELAGIPLFITGGLTHGDAPTDLYYEVINLADLGLFRDPVELPCPAHGHAPSNAQRRLATVILATFGVSETAAATAVRRLQATITSDL